MSIIKIGTRHQVIIPKEIFELLHLQAGDALEATIQEGKIVMIPKRLTPQALIPSLTEEEQRTLTHVRAKINKIQTDLAHSKGLDNDEIDIAIKAGLIDSEQAWWWREDWQKKEREAENNISEGKVSEAFNNIDELINHLNKR
jgi:AbrB family looped-hinge helix DNA binding protein